MKMYHFVFFTALACLLTGCAEYLQAAGDFLFGSPETGEGATGAAADMMTKGGNPPYIVAGLALSTLGTLWRGLIHKRNFHETVSSVEDGFKALDNGQREAVKKVISTSMPQPVKKAVAKARKLLGKK